MDEDDLEDLRADCLMRSKRVYQGLTGDGWWWWWWWWLLWINILQCISP